MTGAEIAEALAMPLSTVSAVLTRIGLGKLSRLEPQEPPNRYERKRPGELLHIDVKKLGRIKGGAGKRISGGARRHNLDRVTDAAGTPRLTVGWEYVHVCVDDATRLAYVEVLSDEQATTAVGFLRRAVAHYEAHGIRVERVMTDNGSGYRATIHALACKTLGVRHLRTRPYRPRTNGKAERFIRTMLGGWAYGAIYASSEERQRALPGWLDFYNRRRPHGSLSHQPPLQRLEALRRNNLVAGRVFGDRGDRPAEARSDGFGDVLSRPHGRCGRVGERRAAAGCERDDDLVRVKASERVLEDAERIADGEHAAGVEPGGPKLLQRALQPRGVGEVLGLIVTRPGLSGRDDADQEHILCDALGEAQDRLSQARAGERRIGDDENPACVLDRSARGRHHRRQRRGSAPQHHEREAGHGHEDDHAEPRRDPGGDHDRRQEDDRAEDEPECCFLALERVAHRLPLRSGPAGSNKPSQLPANGCDCLDQVDGRVHDDPHHVDEVPVDPRQLDPVMMFR